MITELIERWRDGHTAKESARLRRAIADSFDIAEVGGKVYAMHMNEPIHVFSPEQTISEINQYLTDARRSVFSYHNLDNEHHSNQTD